MAGIQIIVQKEGFENKFIHLYREGMFLKGSDPESDSGRHDRLLT